MNHKSGILSALLFFGAIIISALTRADERETNVFYAEDIKAAMHDHIARTVDENDIFYLRDDVPSENLKLRFVQVHDPVRQISDNVYFACTDFHPVAQNNKLYDVDFWLKPDGDQLQVYKVKIHKEPRKSLLYGWYKHPRYTFVNDEISYLYEQ